MSSTSRNDAAAHRPRPAAGRMGDKRMKLAFDNPELDDQFKRSAAAAYCGAADLGELLVAAASVGRPGDAGAWYAAWSAAAERAEGLAARAGDRRSAADAW